LAENSFLSIPVRLFSACVFLDICRLPRPPSPIPNKQTNKQKCPPVEADNSMGSEAESGEAGFRPMDGESPLYVWRCTAGADVAWLVVSIVFYFHPENWGR